MVTITEAGRKHLDKFRAKQDKPVLRIYLGFG
ncbi:MAG: hypothetical protein BWZ01_01011 [Deltaproteobacteria bacterium ADurb.BinA179]|jgi:hypothetical protein|nr:MAG: hypothetical protein BWZ01_01011 [Deltaproteobacteria bacterium ADurb.BinA179]